MKNTRQGGCTNHGTDDDEVFEHSKMNLIKGVSFGGTDLKMEVDQRQLKRLRYELLVITS